MLSFNGNTKEVTITTDTELNVLDLWSRWLDWYLTGDNSKYPPAMAQVGGDDIDPAAGTSVPIYIFLLNGWKVKPKEANHTLNVTQGILLVFGGGDPFAEADPFATVDGITGVLKMFDSGRKTEDGVYEKVTVSGTLTGNGLPLEVVRGYAEIMLILGRTYFGE